MVVVGNQKAGTRSKGTVDKFIVVWVGCNQVELKIGGNETNKWAVKDGGKNHFRSFIIC